MGECVELGIPGLGPAKPLARGGFAQVYQAEQLSLRRKVAVKVLFAPPSDAVAFARFERECLALGAVANHPNIVVVHDRGLTADGRPYITMEYRPGGSLADRLGQRGPLPPAEVRQIGAKICDALAVAHEAGVIHRDVKPANILLSAYDEPALADFGIARIDGGHHTATGQITASVAHASREVLAGEEPTAQSDLYSLGSTMLQLCTGRAPFFRPDEGSVWPLINRAMTEDAPDPSSLGVPEPLASVIAQALSHDRSVRHRSARELGRHLRSGTSPQAAAPTLEVQPLAQPAADPATGADPSTAASGHDPGTTPGTEPIADDGPLTPPTRSPRRRRRRIAFPVALLIAAIAATAGTALALGARPGLGLFAGEPQPELVFPQALIEPLEDDRNYALTIRNAPEEAQFQVLVDGEAMDGGAGRLLLYRSTPGRHVLEVEVIPVEGESTTTEPVEIYVSPGPPLGGFRVNLAAVRVSPETWPAALRQFGDLVADGHKDLVLSLSGDGDYWIFYIDGYGNDSDAAWAYCTERNLESRDCYAAEVQPATARASVADGEATTVEG